MDYREETMEQFRMVGEIVHFQTMKEAQHTITTVWKKFKAEGKDVKLKKIRNHKLDGYLGVCIPTPNDRMDYMIGVTSDENLEHFEAKNIPGGNYIVFEAIGPVPKEIQSVMKDIHEDFLPKSKYNARKAPMLEIYPTGDVTADDYVTELWIPVE